MVLEGFRYAVTAFASSREALEAFRADPDRFDVVITDQTMPGVTGLELATQMLRMRPDLPVILCTGYSEVASREQAEALIREAVGELPVEAAYFTVPFMRNPDFVGREEDLERLHQALTGEGLVGICPAGLLRAGNHGQWFVADVDQLDCLRGYLVRVSGKDRHCVAEVANLVVAQHRPIMEDESVPIPARYVAVREHNVDTWEAQRTAGVDG